MKTTRQVNIEDRSEYFFNDITNINDFDSSFINTDEVSLGVMN